MNTIIGIVAIVVLFVFFLFISLESLGNYIKRAKELRRLKREQYVQQKRENLDILLDRVNNGTYSAADVFRNYQSNPGSYIELASEPELFGALFNWTAESRAGELCAMLLAAMPQHILNRNLGPLLDLYRANISYDERRKLIEQVANRVSTKGIDPHFDLLLKGAHMDSPHPTDLYAQLLTKVSDSALKHHIALLQQYRDTPLGRQLLSRATGDSPDKSPDREIAELIRKE